jgi:hypothetical protein
MENHLSDRANSTTKSLSHPSDRNAGFNQRTTISSADSEKEVVPIPTTTTPSTFDGVKGDRTSTATRATARFNARLEALEKQNALLSAALVAVLRTNGELNASGTLPVAAAGSGGGGEGAVSASASVAAAGGKDHEREDIDDGLTVTATGLVVRKTSSEEPQSRGGGGSEAVPSSSTQSHPHRRPFFAQQKKKTDNDSRPPVPPKASTRGGGERTSNSTDYRSKVEKPILQQPTSKTVTTGKTIIVPTAAEGGGKPTMMAWQARVAKRRDAAGDDRVGGRVAPSVVMRNGSCGKVEERREMDKGRHSAGSAGSGASGGSQGALEMYLAARRGV